MAKVKNISGEGLLLAGRLVLPDQVVDLDAGDVWGVTCKLTEWAPADAAAKKAHKAGAEASEAVTCAARTPIELEADAPTPEEN